MNFEIIKCDSFILLCQHCFVDSRFAQLIFDKDLKVVQLRKKSLFNKESSGTIGYSYVRDFFVVVVYSLLSVTADFSLTTGF